MQFCTPAALAETDLGVFLALYLSLNAPVVAIDELPVGPARAGVVLCVSPAGGLHLQIAIRSLRSGEVVEIASQLDADAAANEVAAVEGALSYAEGMGFLFDEDEIADRGEAARAKAESLWRDLVEGAPDRARRSDRETNPETAVDSAAAAIAEPAVLEIPVAAPPTQAEAIAVDREPIPAESTPIAAAGVLSKFRLSFIAAEPDPAAQQALAELTASPEQSRIRVLSRY